MDEKGNDWERRVPADKKTGKGEVLHLTEDRDFAFFWRLLLHGNLFYSEFWEGFGGDKKKSSPVFWRYLVLKLDRNGIFNINKLYGIYFYMDVWCYVFFYFEINFLYKTSFELYKGIPSFTSLNLFYTENRFFFHECF